VNDLLRDTISVEKREGNVVARDRRNRRTTRIRQRSSKRDSGVVRVEPRTGKLSDKAQVTKPRHQDARNRPPASICAVMSPPAGVAAKSCLLIGMMFASALAVVSGS
jgi:hypothetical protein